MLPTLTLGPRLYDWGRSWPRRKMHLHHSKFGRLRQTMRSQLWKYAGKIWPVASRLSRSLKVIGTITDWSVSYDFLLVTVGEWVSK